MGSNGVDCSVISGSSKGIELSLYDQHRRPHDAITDSTEITISPRSLSAELMCPICLDMLNKTHTTKECLHRFCYECITTALQKGNKECPTCRKKLVSRRSLRPDPNFDSLIRKIYPNRDEYNKMQDQAFARLQRHSSREALQLSIEQGMREQAQARKQRKSIIDGERRKRRLKEGSDRESSVEPSLSETCAPASSSIQQEVELCLRPHPKIDPTDKVTHLARQSRYLKTTANATVDHLCRYLAMRAQLDEEEVNRVNDEPTTLLTSQQLDKDKIKQNNNGLKSEDYRVYANANNTQGNMGILLGGDMTLDSVRVRYWKKVKPLELHFVVESDIKDEAPNNSNTNVSSS